MSAQTPTAKRRFIRWSALEERFDPPPDKSTVHRWELKGLFPRRLQIAPGMVGWDADAVDHWFESRQAPSAGTSPNPRAQRRGELEPAAAEWAEKATT